MDLRLSRAEETPAEREAVDAMLGPSAGGAAPGRDRLLPCLLAIQSRIGWVSEGALNYVSRRLDVAPAEAFGVASFYRMIALSPRPPVMAYVCEDLTCRLQGSESVCRDLERRLGPPAPHHGEGSFLWQRSACLGQCDRAPAALVARSGPAPQYEALPQASLSTLTAAIAGRSLSPAPGGNPTIPQLGRPGLRLLQRVGRVDPSSLEAYRSAGGGRALQRALELGPAGVIAELEASRLLGRGGAAFPTWRKWEAVSRSAVKPRYLVCNADESEPGTFKDRVLLEEDPFALLEGAVIGGFATGCERGFVYIRGEYPLSASRLETACAAAREAGLLGGRILGHDFSFDLEIRRGAGAYICGEETALFNSIEGYRGEPRSKPPFPVTAGLFGQPTVINNVETLACVTEILREGGAAFASVGTRDSTGTRLFCVSGNVRDPGIYEVPLGTPLRTLLQDAGAGVPEGKIRAVLLGGAAGTFLGPEDLDLPLSFEATRAAGATLGSGAVIVFDDRADLRDVLLRLAAFFREESCGQCVPCRVGTVRQEEVLKRFLEQPLSDASATRLLLSEIAQAMRDASICGLGQTAAAAVQSAMVKLELGRGPGR
jgi:NADH-quinone oxidoreductase subunit F